MIDHPSCSWQLVRSRSSRERGSRLRCNIQNSRTKGKKYHWVSQDLRMLYRPNSSIGAYTRPFIASSRTSRVHATPLRHPPPTRRPRYRLSRRAPYRTTHTTNSSLSRATSSGASSSNSRRGSISGSLTGSTATRNKSTALKTPEHCGTGLWNQTTFNQATQWTDATRHFPWHTRTTKRQDSWTRNPTAPQPHPPPPPNTMSVQGDAGPSRRP